MRIGFSPHCDLRDPGPRRTAPPSTRGEVYDLHPRIRPALGPNASTPSELDEPLRRHRRQALPPGQEVRLDATGTTARVEPEGEASGGAEAAGEDDAAKAASTKAAWPTPKAAADAKAACPTPKRRLTPLAAAKK